MENVFKGIQRDVSKFKSKFINPQVLLEKLPEMKAAYSQAVDDYLASKKFKKLVEAHAKVRIGRAIGTMLESKQFYKAVHFILAEQLKKGIEINGD